MALLAILTILPLVSSTIPSPADRWGNIRVQQRDVLPACEMLIRTDIWTTCETFLAQYNVYLPYFVQMNPTLESDCANFSPGSDYCLLRNFPAAVSIDGTCSRNASSGTCIGSGFGDCCGKSGRCGSTSEFCAIGNCLAGDCPGLGYSTDGNCGPDFGYTICGTPYGTCCSNAGKCGSTSTECGVGNCQSGDCAGQTSSTTTSASSTPLPSPYTPTPDGTCGFTNKYMCNGTALYFGSCCSAAGYCGVTDYHCSDLLGCQPEFGLCDKTVLLTQVVSGTAIVSATTIRSSTSSKSSSVSSASLSSSKSSIASSTVSSKTSSTLSSIRTSVTSVTTTSTTTTSAASATTSFAGSVCISGYGAGNYIGLCDFCCNFGYCPPGPCTCATFGAQVPPPAATWPAGVPDAGLDDSYLGLCSFACNHGYCPVGACHYP